MGYGEQTWTADIAFGKGFIGYSFSSVDDVIFVVT